MTVDEARRLIPDIDVVVFNGKVYKVAEGSEFFGIFLVGIYDQPPSKHIEYVGPASLDFTGNSTNMVEKL